MYIYQNASTSIALSFIFCQDPWICHMLSEFLEGRQFDFCLSIPSTEHKKYLLTATVTQLISGKSRVWILLPGLSLSGHNDIKYCF